MVSLWPLWRLGVAVTVLWCALVVACAASSSSSGSNVAALRRELLADGFVEEASLFHRIMRKDSVQVDLPYRNNAINTNWLYQQLSRVHKNKHAAAAAAAASRDGSPVMRDSYWDFVPAQMGTVFANSPKSWQGTCYEQLTASLTINNSQNGTLLITASKKKSTLCSEFYMFCTRESCHLSVIEFTGKHTINIQWAQYEYDDVSQHGMFIFLYPLGFEGTLISVAKTISLFYDPYKGMVNANVEFLAEKMQWAMVERPSYAAPINISQSDIKSGDYLAIARLDGLDPMIMWGTGGHTGHTAMALWFDGELYICESTDTEGGSLSYWPPPYGIIRTPFQQWITQAQQANYLVGILRLAPEYQKLFNETAANQWFFTVESQPYGWHNFIFTFIDTIADNLPRPVTPDLAEVIAGVAERIIPFDSKSSIYNMLIQGLNKRLNSTCTTMNCIYGIIDPLNMTLTAAGAIPEQDSWRYGGNYSMVCDVFVCELYKNAGIFGNLTNQFQCTEHTPKDTYQWAIFDGNWQRPKACVTSDPQLPYCQLTGKYVLTLPGYNSIPPYANMNNACPSLPPVYYRPVIC